MTRSRQRSRLCFLLPVPQNKSSDGYSAFPSELPLNNKQPSVFHILDCLHFQLSNFEPLCVAVALLDRFHIRPDDSHSLSPVPYRTTTLRPIQSRPPLSSAALHGSYLHIPFISPFLLRLNLAIDRPVDQSPDPNLALCGSREFRSYRRRKALKVELTSSRIS